MGKYPQNRFRRLVLVDPSEHTRQQSSIPACGTGGFRPADQPAREQLKALRMAVMPTFSRGIWLEAISAMTRFVRSYFAGETKPRRQGVVLSFHRPGFARPWGEHRVETGYVTKKVSTGVCWSSDQAPQEGGRG